MSEEGRVVKLAELSLLEMKGMVYDISKQMKGMVYDISKQINNSQNQLAVLNSEIDRREKELQNRVVMPVAEPEPKQESELQNETKMD